MRRGKERKDIKEEREVEREKGLILALEMLFERKYIGGSKID